VEEGDYCIIKERTVIANAITYCNMASQDALREVRGHKRVYEDFNSSPVACQKPIAR